MTVGISRRTSYCSPATACAAAFVGAIPARLILLLFLMLCCSTLFPSQLHAGENLFNSGAAIKEELGRLGSEGKLFLKAPVDPYLVQTGAAAGLIAVAYIFDKQLSSNGSRHGVLRGITDAGSDASNPFLHLGIAATVYTAGAASGNAGVMDLGEEMGEALVLADSATFVLKGAVGRGRPYQTESKSSFRPFHFEGGYDSLPSMHTASSFALAHVAASHSESWSSKFACYAAAGLAGFSRVYQGKHWASDVLIGAAIGELAGDAVTRYRALQPGKVSVAPTAIGGTPALALVGKF
ncbi:membrane-associated phosphatase, PAP2_like_5 family [Citrifermentans bemidjiense Bem]|uniref:Membrane-associated phosphatase, PAP2_like_5 family n=1 Tax=Citrifermentans bemidjiense (strain ATCC BAA-1014 / DSM 16622 / JCM 12645 / Bem) TaxID=404380 RepID=B5E8S1_CITBB|nr:membrane-associated phosphatase, PAP2_like_5 family [Citrifermentans bemidjiense Bem]